MQFVGGSAPAEPNAWTDGSLKHPGLSLAVGSFGIWHPDRVVAQLTPEECDFSAPLPDLPGLRPSSSLKSNL